MKKKELTDQEMKNRGYIVPPQSDIRWRIKFEKIKELVAVNEDDHLNDFAKEQIKNCINDE